MVDIRMRSSTEKLQVEKQVKEYEYGGLVDVEVAYLLHVFTATVRCWRLTRPTLTCVRIHAKDLKSQYTVDVNGSDML